MLDQNMLNQIVSDWNTAAAFVWAALFNSLPAVCILTGCIWLLLDRVKGWSAATRYAGWCGVLALAVMLPVAQFLAPHRTGADETLPTVDVASAGAATVVLQDIDNAPAVFEAAPPAAMPLPPATAPAAASRLTPGGMLLLVWVLAMAVQLIRFALALRTTFVLKRLAWAPDADVEGRWNELLAGDGELRRPVTLAISSRVTMPAVVGYRRPVVLIPQSLAERLTGESLDGILLHELAHVRRRDDWAIAVQRLLEAVFVLHPLVHLITSKMELQREIACDDWVLRKQQAREYAFCLTAVAECCVRPAHSGLMGLAMERPSQLSERVEMLLDTTRSVATRIPLKWLGSFVSALGLACVVSLQLPQVMAFPVQTDTVKPVQPDPQPAAAPVAVTAPDVHVVTEPHVSMVAKPHVVATVRPRVHVVAVPHVVTAITTDGSPQDVNKSKDESKDRSDAAKDLAREQAELSAQQARLARQEADLVRRQMDLAHRHIDQARLQRQIQEKLRPEMRRLQEQLSHMHFDQNLRGADLAAIQAEAKIASLQAMSALSQSGLTGDHPRLSAEQLKKLHTEEARYKALSAQLRAQQEKAAQEFSRRMNEILHESAGQGGAKQGK